MQLSGTKFGEIELTQEKVITLASGLMGFPEEKSFVLLEPRTAQGVAWLQSLSTPALAFPVIDSASIVPSPEYDVGAIAKQADLRDGNLSLFVVVVPSPNEPTLRGNLLAPIAVDATTGKGAQVMLDVHTYSPATVLSAQAA